MIRLLVLSICSFLLTSCSRHCDAIKQFKDFTNTFDVETQSIVRNGVLFELKYQPAKLLAARESQQLGADISVQDSLLKKYSQYNYFLLSISKKGRAIVDPKEGFSTYSALIQTLSFQMEPYVNLTTSIGDTLDPIAYNFEHTYQLDNKSRLLFAFKKKKIPSQMDFNLLEFGLGCGNIQFKLDKNTLEKIYSSDENTTK